MFAPDVAGLGYAMLAVLAAALGGSLCAGAATAAVFVVMTRQRWIWWLTPGFALLWFGVGVLALRLIRGF